MNPIYTAIISLLAGVVIGIIIGAYVCKRDRNEKDDYDYYE